MLKQLQSWRHGFSLALSERLRGSRGVYQERPAVRLAGLVPAQRALIDDLAARHAVRFEQTLNAKTALGNYEYLDLLERGFAAGGVRVPRPAVLCDAGCASFWYAAALAAFFKPGRLIGVDVEGYRRLRGGHTRIDYARGYLANLGRAEFVVADYRRYVAPADLITSFFPFVTPGAILAWRLPLSLLDPAAFFAQARSNLKPGGWFVMVNHGAAEAAQAHLRCAAAQFSLQTSLEAPGPLSAYRAKTPVISLWQPV